MTATLQSALDLYLSNRCELRKKSHYDYKAIITHYAGTVLSKPLGDITMEDVKILYDEAKARSISQARKMLTYAATITQYTIDWFDLRINNVFRRFRKVTKVVQPPVRKRQLNEQSLPKFFKSVSLLPVEARTYMLLLLYTGCRKEEIGGLQWSEVDLKSGVITIPGRRRKNGHEHRIVLSDIPLALLKSYKNQSINAPDNRLFYPGVLTCYESIVALTGIDCRPHDLRRTFATICTGLKFPDIATKQLMGHKANDITARYVHLLDTDLREYNRLLVQRLHEYEPTRVRVQKQPTPKPQPPQRPAKPRIQMSVEYAKAYACANMIEVNHALTL